MSERTRKLIALRSRTDHDLLILINRELEKGMALADVAPGKTSPLFAQAEKAWQTAAALLQKISGVDGRERARMERKLNELRSRLKDMPAYATVRAYPASFAS